MRRGKSNQLKKGYCGKYIELDSILFIHFDYQTCLTVAILQLLVQLFRELIDRFLYIY